MPILEVTALPQRLDLSCILTVGAETLVAEFGLAAGNAFMIWDDAQVGRVYSGGSV